jgi:hypothetical protein
MLESLIKTVQLSLWASGYLDSSRLIGVKVHFRGKVIDASIG